MERLQEHGRRSATERGMQELDIVDHLPLDVPAQGTNSTLNLGKFWHLIPLLSMNRRSPSA
jgi:hypothetical protein